MIRRILLASVAAFGGASVAGAAALRRRVDREVRNLAARAAARPRDRVQLDALPELPPPVRRYFRFAGIDGRPRARFARLRHGGAFRTGADARWMPIRGEEYIAADPPGFVWHATMRPLPFLPVHGRDAYLDGHGSMIIRPLGFVPLANGKGPHFDQSALLRWMGELFWLPVALLPGPRITWVPIDERTALLKGRDASIEATATIYFDDDGRLLRFEADRYRAAAGGSLLTRFIGRADRYEEVQGYRVPMEIEGSWLLDAGELTYARFTVEQIEYDVMHPF